MISSNYFFPCPNCHEIIGSDANRCKYCQHPVDPYAAEAAGRLQQQVNQACNEASLLRNLAGFMWIAFAVQFFFVMWGRVLFGGLMVIVPIMLIIWQVRYGSLKTNDVDFKLAKRNRNITLFLWLPVPFVVIALIAILAMA